MQTTLIHTLLPIFIIMITRVTVVEMSAGVAAFYTLFSSILTSPIRTHRTPPGNIKSK